MFQRSSTLNRTLLPLAFFGVLITLLVVSESLGTSQQATTVIINTPNAVEVQQDPTPLQSLPRCKEDRDCPLPTTYCGPSGKCTELTDPTCDCGQPQVLRCYEHTGKARFLYCPNGCTETENGTICQ